MNKKYVIRELNTNRYIIADDPFNYKSIAFDLNVKWATLFLTVEDCEKCISKLPENTAYTILPVYYS